MLTRLRARLGQEGGSVVVAVLLVTVAFGVLLSLAAAVDGGLNKARVDQNRINAFQHANAGIDQALYRIDRRAFSGGSYVATSSGFTDSVTLDGSRYDIVANRVTAGDDSTWTVRSTGIDASGKSRLAIATVSTQPLFENAFFTVHNFSLAGNQGTPMAYNSATDPTAAAAVTPVPASMGTNGVLDGSGISLFADLWAGFTMYGRATQAAADADCHGCGGAPKVAPAANQMVITPPSAPSVVSPCPSGGNVNGGTIQPGDYLCSSLTLNGTVTVGTGGNGTGTVRIWVNGPFDASGTVNRYQPPKKFQIFQPVAADGQPYSNHDICDSDLWALLFTPGLRINCNGSHQASVHGAVIADLYSGTGNHFDFFYDITTSSVMRDGKYSVTNWRECPPGAADC
jgi:hypothetical protein